jgi:hypothetical protein
MVNPARTTKLGDAMQLNFKMPALLIALMLSTVASAAHAADGGTPALKGPQAVFTETKFTFEPLFEGADVKHDFVIENKGDAPLVIKKVKPG